MNTLANTAQRAFHLDGPIVIDMASGVEFRFPVAKNPRPARGTPPQLDPIELAPLGFHWPNLEEDLSFPGIPQGCSGPYQNDRTRAPRPLSATSH